MSNKIRISVKSGSILVICAWLSAAAVSGQIIQTERFENEQKGRDEYFSVFPLKEQGLALVRQQNDYEDGKQKWEVLLLDTLLQESGRLSLMIDPRYPLIGYEHSGNDLYLLYREGETNRTGMELIHLDLSTAREMKRYTIQPELDFKITHFVKVGSNIALGGYVSNEPAILLYEPSTNQLKVIPGFFQKNNELVELRQNVNGTFNVVIIDRSNRDDRKVIFRTFAEDGTQLLEDVVSMDENRTLQTSISSSLIREDLVVVGTWGTRQSKQSSGVFAFPVNPFADQRIKYLAFGELDSFLNYLPSKRRQRLKENAEEDVKMNRVPAFTAYVQPFRLEEHADGFLLLAEVYNPSQSTNPYYNNPYANPYYPYPSGYMGYKPYWRNTFPDARSYRPTPYGNVNRPAEDVRSLAAVLISYDGTGKKLWDHSVSFDEVKRPSLDQVSDFYVSQSSVYFLYKKESEILVKIIDKKSGEEKELKETVKLKNTGDVLRHENKTEDGLRHWYGKSFYYWGYQTIKNVTYEDRVREIFYINKIKIP